MKITIDTLIVFIVIALALSLAYQITFFAEIPTNLIYLESLKPKAVHITTTNNNTEFTWLTESVPDSCTLSTSLSLTTVPKYSNFLYTHYVFKVSLPSTLASSIYTYEIRCTRGLYFASRTFPISLRSEAPHKLIFLGDFSTSKIGDATNPQHTKVYKPNILEVLKKDSSLSPAAAIWHLGDIAYDLFSNNGQRGLEFLIDIEPLASATPYIAVVGNHEIRDNFRDYMSYFGNGLYFTQTVGPAVIIAISSEFDFYSMKPNLFPYKHAFWQYLKQKQMKWLEGTLAGIDRETHPWVVVTAHKPLYCSLNKASSMIMQACLLHARVMREAYEEVFLRFKVDLGMFGHIHLYERTFPVAYGEVQGEVDDRDYWVNPIAPIYLVNGVAGNLEGNDIVFNITEEPGEWSVTIGESLGYGILTIYNHTHLKYEQIAFGNTQWDYAFTDFYHTRRVEDLFWIVKN